MKLRRKIVSVLLVLCAAMCLANVAYLWAQPPAVPVLTLNDLGINTPYVISVGGYSIGANEVISSARAASFITLNTGQGNYELYAMNQDVETTDAVVFATVNTGQGAFELYEMDQAVDSTASVVFNDVNVTDELMVDSEAITNWDDLSSYIALGGNGTTVFPDTFTILYNDLLYTSYYSNGTIFSQNADAYIVLNATTVASTANAAGVPVWHQADRVYPRASIKLGPGEYDIGNNYIEIANHVVLKGSGPSVTIISGNHTTQVIGVMWSNFTLDFGIEDLYIKGLSGTTDYPLNIDCDTIPSSYPAGEEIYYTWHYLDNIHVSDYQTYSIRVITDGSGGFTLSYWNQVRVTGTIYINRMFDSMLHNIYCYGLILDSVTSTHFDDWYVGGANSPNVRLYGDSANNPNRDNVFSNFRSDNAVSNALSVEGYSCYNQFINCQFTNKDLDGSGSPAYAIQFVGYANHNQITGSYIGASTTNVTKPVGKWTGAVSFGADTHDNKVLNNNYDPRSFSEISLFSGGFVSGNLVDTRIYSDPQDILNTGYWGEIIEGFAGEAIDQGEVCYLNADGSYYLADANSTTTMFVVAMAAEDMLTETSGMFLTNGYLRLDAWTWTIGSENPIYASWDAGGITQTIPSATGNQVQIVGYAAYDNCIRFCPDWTVIEIG